MDGSYTVNPINFISHVFVHRGEVFNLCMSWLNIMHFSLSITIIQCSEDVFNCHIYYPSWFLIQASLCRPREDQTCAILCYLCCAASCPHLSLTSLSLDISLSQSSPVPRQILAADLPKLSVCNVTR